MPTLTQRLSEARLAYHQLMTGGQPVEVRDSDGSSIRYSTANASRLLAYISQLEAELLVEAGGTRQSRRAVRPQWT